MPDENQNEAVEVPGVETAASATTAAELPVAPAQVEPVEVAHDAEMDCTVAATNDLAVQVSTLGFDTHPSVLKRAASLLHEIMRRVIFEGEEILEKIEEALYGPKAEVIANAKAPDPDSQDPTRGE